VDERIVITLHTKNHYWSYLHEQYFCECVHTCQNKRTVTLSSGHERGVYNIRFSLPI